MMNKVTARAWLAVVPLVALALLVMVPVAAQEVVDAAPVYPNYVEIGPRGELILTPDVVARLALDRNLQLAAAGAGIREAQGRLQQARSAEGFTASISGAIVRMGPTTSFELPAGEDGGGADGGGGGEAIQLSSNHLETATLQVNKPIYTSGRIELGQGMARTGVLAAELTEGSVRRALLLASQEGAYAVLRLKQLEGVAASRVTAVSEHVRLSEVMEDAGVVAHFEVVQAQTELSNSRQDLITVQTGVKQARASLCNLVNFPQTTEVDVTDGPPPTQPEGDLPTLIDQAWANRPEVRLAETGLAIARMNTKLARADMGWNVALTGSYARQSVAGLTGQYSWQAGIAFEKPLFDSGTRKGKIAEALAGVAAAELQLEKTQEDIALTVAQQSLAIDEAIEKIATAAQGVVEARERRRMAQLRYREGVTQGVEVLDADTALAAAEGNLVNAQYDLQLAIVRLQAAMGVLDVTEQEVEPQ